jgi:hypothetical protein
LRSSTLSRALVALPVAGLLVGGIGTAWAEGGSTSSSTPSSTPTSRSGRGDHERGDGNGGETATTRAPRRPETTTTRSVEDVKAKCASAIDERLAALDRLAGKVGERPGLTPEHAAALQAVIADAKDGLTALEATIQADTDAHALREHCTQVVNGFRVYLLVVPLTNQVVAADTITAAADKLAGRIADLQAAIDQAEAAGRDVSHDRELLAELRARVAAAHDAAAGVPDAVLGLTPADWNSGAAKPLLRDGQRSLHQAREDLSAAVKAARQIVHDLRHDEPASTTPTTTLTN